MINYAVIVLSRYMPFWRKCILGFMSHLIGKRHCSKLTVSDTYLFTVASRKENIWAGIRCLSYMTKHYFKTLDIQNMALYDPFPPFVLGTNACLLLPTNPIDEQIKHTQGFYNAPFHNDHSKTCYLARCSSHCMTSPLPHSFPLCNNPSYFLTVLSL